MTTYEEKIAEFSEFLKAQFTDPQGTFYETSATDMLDNIMLVIAQNPNSVQILQNTEVMVQFGKLIGREDFLKPDGEFNPMVIFEFSKDEHGFDMLGVVPAFIRPTLLKSMGLT